jgi:integrase
MAKLTDVKVEKASVGTHWDSATTGLGLKVTPRDRRIWILQLRYPGHKVQTRRTLGYYPALGLADARRKAERWYALAKDGINPAAVAEDERREAEAKHNAEAARRANTFAHFAEKYIAGRTNRRAAMDAREIRRMLIAPWAARPLHEIAPRDVRALIDGLKTRAPYDARNAWTHMVQIFKHAVHEELITASPCASLDRRLCFEGAKIGHRQRVLNDDELRAFWRGSGRLGFPGGPFFQLLALTACRRNELAKARWSELHPELRRILRDGNRSRVPVDWAAVPAEVKVLTVPRERFKSDTDHAVQLSDDACRIVETLPRVGGDYLFTLNGTSPVWFDGKYKPCLDKHMLRTLRALARSRGDDPGPVRLVPWVLHDLRRVVRTNLSALRDAEDRPLVEDHIAEMVLGHGRKGLQRIYDQHRYKSEIRAALEAWAAKLRAIVGQPRAPHPDNVVALRRARR